MRGREKEWDLGLSRFDQRSSPELRESNYWKWFSKKKKKIEIVSKACKEAIQGLGQVIHWGVQAGAI